MTDQPSPTPAAGASERMTAERLAEIRHVSRAAETWPGLRDILNDILALVDEQARDIEQYKREFAASQFLASNEYARAQSLERELSTLSARAEAAEARAERARAEALEEAAKVCDVWARTVPSNDPYMNQPTPTSRAIASICCDVGQKSAASIRALRTAPPPTAKEG